MRTLLYFLPLFLLQLNAAVAQSSYDDQNSVSMPSANNDFLKSQPDFDVNLYSGIPKINIPLYVLPSRVLNMPIELHYVNGGGIKVQDVAGFMGLGWQLSAGGYITRVVRDLPDEQTNGYIGTNLAGQTVNAGLTNSVISKVGSGQLDGEPDLFTIQTPSFSFNFVLDQYGNPVFPNNTGLKFSHNLYKNYTNTYWVVTDADGTQYYFGSTPNSRENATSTWGTASTVYTCTWYLDKIVAFNSKDIINLTYQTASDYTNLHYLQSQTTFVSSPNCTTPSTVNSSYSQSMTYNAPKYISKISSSLGEVDFIYAFDRQDFANAGRLTTMAVYPYDPATSVVGTALKTFQFNYGYFGAPSADFNALRLRLDNISLLSRISTDPPLTYKSFDYNSTPLPPRTSVEFDYWGYYNTNSSGTPIVPAANKTPDPIRVFAGILTGVHDLSGQIQQLQYEPNMYLNGSTNTVTGGVRIKQMVKTLPSGESLNTSYYYTDANGKSTGQIDANNLYYTNLTKTINVLATNGQIYCAWSGTNTSSESLYNTFDLNGVIVGYSAVKMVSQSGGYEIDNFTNFADFPDVFTNATSDGSVYGFTNSRQLSAATSYSYKRGLLLSKTLFKASGDIVESTVNTYGSLDALSAQALGVRVSIFTYITAGASAWLYGSYTNNFENYRLIHSVKYLFDQNNQSLKQQVSASFTYAANHRLIQRMDYTDSKGLSRSKISYYTEDTNTPGLNGDQQYAINTLLKANNIDAVIHTTEIRNGTYQDTHYAYLNFEDPNLNTKILLANKATFVNHNAQVEEQQYQYDPTYSNLTSINKLGGPFLSTQYSYGQSYATAKVKNAVNLSSIGVSQGTTTGVLTFAPNQLGTSQTIPFTVDYTGTVVLALTYNSGVSGSMITTLGYTVSGPTTPPGGTLCVSTNNSCSIVSSHATLTGLAPGSYTLTAIPQTSNNNATVPAYLNFTYPSNIGTLTGTSEFFYEGFESSASAATATPFAGIRYYSGAYTVPFTIPNSRSYQVDYHYLSNGTWYAQSKPYTNNMVLNDGSAIDEVRVHPTDAQMTTYTYDPLNGITSQADVRNRFTFYSYDGFGRLSQIRDNDGNIITAYDYQYQVNPGQTCQKPVITSVTDNNLAITVNFLPSPGSTACNINIFDQTSGQTIVNSTGSCGSPASFSIGTATNIYVVTVTSYTSDCSSGVTSIPYTLTP